MANYENLNLTGALGNAPQKIHPHDFPGFDNDMPLTLALKTPLTTHLSTPSSQPPPLLPISQTPTLIPTSTSVSSSSITTFEPCIPPKGKTTHELSTLPSSSPITHCSLLLSPTPTPIHYHESPSFIHPLWLTHGTNTSISLLMLHIQKTLFNFRNASKDRWEEQPSTHNLTNLA